MLVSLVNGITTYYLAGQAGVAESVHSSASNVKIAAGISKQTSRYVRAAAAATRDRLNLQTEIRFTTVRTFATPALAELFAADYDTTYPRSGYVFLTTTGATPSWRYLPDAVVDPPEREVIGCSVILNYTITGGLMSTDIPGTWSSEIPWPVGGNWES